MLLSTTPTLDGTPLQGPNTNLAGVFQINDVSHAEGLNREKPISNVVRETFSVAA